MFFKGLTAAMEMCMERVPTARDVHLRAPVAADPVLWFPAGLAGIAVKALFPLTVILQIAQMAA